MRALVIAAMFVSGCVAREAGKPSSDSDDAFVLAYAEKHHHHLVPEESIPASDWRTISNLSEKGPIWRTDEFSLTLALSNRFTVTDNGRYRTNSRYQLYGRDGTELSSAESVLASEDRGASDEKGSIRIEVDREKQLLLVVEEKGWSVERIIIFSLQPHKSEPIYPRVPVRTSLNPAHSYEIIGLETGRLYIREDGKVYAFPIEELETKSDLSYSIG